MLYCISISSVGGGGVGGCGGGGGVSRCSCTSWLRGGSFAEVVHGPELTVGLAPNRFPTSWLSAARPTTSAPKYPAMTVNVESGVRASPAGPPPPPGGGGGRPGAVSG